MAKKKYIFDPETGDYFDEEFDDFQINNLHIAEEDFNYDDYSDLDD